MLRIAETAIVRSMELLVVGDDVVVMDFAILGEPNEYPELFVTPEERRVILGDRVRIHPRATIYEGATLGKNVTLGEGSSVGSKTIIGANSRVLYRAQVHDQISVGENCIVANFVGDNCSIGSGCSVFGALVHRYSTPDPARWDEVDEIGPTLEDDVVVGWGAVLIGPIRIGRSARIRPNAVVSRDVFAGETYG